MLCKSPFFYEAEMQLENAKGVDTLVHELVEKHYHSPMPVSKIASQW